MQMKRFEVRFSVIHTSQYQVFILHSENQATHVAGSSQKFRGLGYVDSHKDILDIVFDIKYEVPVASGTPKRKSKAPRQGQKTIEIELHQDKTALRSRKGDTGSVVWKARYVMNHFINLMFSLNLLVWILHSLSSRNVIPNVLRVCWTNLFLETRMSSNLGLSFFLL